MVPSKKGIDPADLEPVNGLVYIISTTWVLSASLIVDDRDFVRKHGKDPLSPEIPAAMSALHIRIRRI